MQALGWTEAQVLRLPWDDPERCRAYAIADNRTAELAAWDDGTLAGQVGDLSAAGIPMDAFGFEWAEAGAGPAPEAGDLEASGGAGRPLLPLPGLRLPLALRRRRRGGAAVSAALKIERVKTSELTPDAANARLHDRRNLDAIKASLEAFGQTRPLVVTEAGLVLAGNGTLAAALELGWETVDVTRVPFASEEEARAFALADNRTGELAQWNAPVLMEALESLALEGWKLEELGFAPRGPRRLEAPPGARGAGGVPGLRRGRRDQLPLPALRLRMGREAGVSGYRVPSLEEVRRVPWNGYVVASLFAGGGGSSTGYRMAGYRVAYANDVVEEARATYRANCADYTAIDGTDVREVRGPAILDAVEAVTGRRELDVLDGSPPCQAFSTAGPRDRTWGLEVAHADGTQQRSDDLFYEYARLLAELRPKAFVAENVAGLVRGVARGYFKRILAALKEPGYRVEARLLDAQWLGVPQARQRLIFVGVREDLGLGARPSPGRSPTATRWPPSAPTWSGSRRAATATSTCSTTRPPCRRAPSPPRATPRSAATSSSAGTARGASSRSTSSRRSAASRPTTSSPAPTARAGPGSATACRR